MRQPLRSFLITLFLAVALDFILVTTSFPQQDTTSKKPVKLILKDGSELIGTIVSEDSLSISFKTLGNISIIIPREQVKDLKHLSNHIVIDDPNHTRLLLAPTAKPLASGQGYFSAYEIFFPLVAVGVTDFIMFAGGMSLFPGAESQLFYFATKVTPIQIGKLDVAGGVLYINTTSRSSGGVGILYGVTSYGNPNTSLTFGLGWGFSRGRIADKPIILLGGELRTSNNAKLITENWFPPNSDIAFLSFGVRFFGEDLAADLGFIYPAGSKITGFPFIPWLGFVYNFGTAK